MTDLDRLGLLVFLHDIGKLFPGFQAKGWPEGAWKHPKTGHLQEGFDIFTTLGDKPAAKALHIERLVEWGVDSSLLLAVLSHHGRPLKHGQDDRTAVALHRWRQAGDYDPDRAADRIGALLPNWFGSAFEPLRCPLPSTPVFEHLLAGLTALADWIGSDARRFRWVAELDNDYMARARSCATDALSAFGLDAGNQRAARTSPVSFREVSTFESPNAQQELVAGTKRDAHLLILEAETGSGKTEAALWRYAQLFETGLVDGLYFAVPTRAAAAQLHGRVAAASRRLFGDADPQPVLAVPGYMRAGSTEGTPLPNWKVRWDDEADADEATLAGRWAAEHSKRYLAAQIAVGTVDQAMLGALLVKHAHLRAASLSRSLLVIDEVHASDRFMTAIQKRLLDAHLAVGGYAMLMSATLGSIARATWLGQQTPTFEQAVAAPYPAVWTKGEPVQHASAEENAHPKSVRMEALATMAPDTAASQALAAARDGARVLIIRNTVASAVETLQVLEAIAEPADAGLLFKVGDVVTLHHSRFAPEDRKRLDHAVEQALKPNKARALGGTVVIGTQTLEQSLDIDADLLLTDLCPIDVLLQRIGRLHRHDLPRPQNYRQPHCMVMIPEDGLSKLLKPGFENGLGAWRAGDGTLQGIYRDLAILELTRRLVDQHPIWKIPEMNRLLVESATHGDPIEKLHGELGLEWQNYYQNVVAGELAQDVIARLYAIDRDKRFEELSFPDAEESIRTRLGAEGARLQFSDPLPDGPFGECVTEIVLPAHWSYGISLEDVPVILSGKAKSFTFTVGDALFAYDRHGIRLERETDGSAEGPAHPV